MGEKGLVHRILQEEFQKIRENTQIVKETKFVPDFRKKLLSSSLDYELHDVRVLFCSILNLQDLGQHWYTLSFD